MDILARWVALSLTLLALGACHAETAEIGGSAAAVARERVEVAPAPGRAGIGMRTLHLGRRGAPQRVPALLDRRADANETVLVREGVEERYETGPLGVEQTYRIEARPPGAGPLTIEVAFDGLVAAASDPDTVVLRDGAGATRAVYRGLRVDDAAGRRLAAHMEASGGTVTLVADDEGATYPVVVDPLVWAQQAELTPSASEAGYRFGTSVAIDGDTAIVGSGGDGGTYSVYVYVRSGTTWTQQAELSPPDDAWFFGAAVALSGDTAIVGAPGPDWGAEAIGSAYVFVRSGTTWAQQAELTLGEAGGCVFGTSVAVSGATAIVGDPMSSSPEFCNEGAGVASVFVRSGTTWSLQAELTPGDGMLFDRFGTSVALGGETAVVSAFGAAYIFAQSGTTWTQQAEMNGTADGFGGAVAISGGTVLFGWGGTVYVFAQSGTTWTQQAELTGNAGTQGEPFGESVALSGGTAIVSAGGQQVGENLAPGAAYVFVRSGTSWTQMDELTASDGVENDLFASGPGTIAVSGSTVIVGAPLGNYARGAAYVYVVGHTPGDACTSPTDCISDFCVDGVCCATACTGAPCEACSVAAGAPADGTCAPLTGPACDDGDACTTSDTCVAGTCKGTPLDCAAHNECEENGTCDPTTGQCTHPSKPENTPCSTGTCESGVCTIELGGCGCRAAGAGSDAAAWGAALLALLPAMRRRRGLGARGPRGEGEGGAADEGRGARSPCPRLPAHSRRDAARGSRLEPSRRGAG